MQFTDFIIFAAAAEAIYPNDPNGQRNCRACLYTLLETARRFPGTVLAEAAKKDSRKGVVFKQKTLDDLETGVFGSRLADRLWQEPGEPAKGKTTKTPDRQRRLAYGNSFRSSVRNQGNVLADMNWEQWEVVKTIMELGGVDPALLLDPRRSAAERLELVNRINWENVTVPRLKARLGPSFKVPQDWKREFAIAKLKKIKAAVEQNQPITDPHERKLLGIWRTLEVQLGGEGDEPSQILPAGRKNDVGMTKLPMRRADRKRFYNALTGNQNEGVDSGRALQLSPQSAHDYHERGRR